VCHSYALSPNFNFGHSRTCIVAYEKEDAHFTTRKKFDKLPLKIMQRWKRIWNNPNFRFWF
jgi:hypothetical protein